MLVIHKHRKSGNVVRTMFWQRQQREPSLKAFFFITPDFSPKLFLLKRNRKSFAKCAVTWSSASQIAGRAKWTAVRIWEELYLIYVYTEMNPSAEKGKKNQTEIAWFYIILGWQSVGRGSKHHRNKIAQTHLPFCDLKQAGKFIQKGPLMLSSKVNNTKRVWSGQS